MYLNFYGFKERPFNTTPDPRVLYPTPGHREALARLVYGIQQSKGFIALTGEVGTGKTTLLHALLQRLDDSIAVAETYKRSLDLTIIARGENFSFSNSNSLVTLTMLGTCGCL